MNQQSIQLHDLAIGYPSRHGWLSVAAHLEATAPAATLTCLIGRNGMGKSTLLRTVARMQPRLGGDIDIGAKPIDSFTATAFARQLGIVLTKRTDAENLTVGELVALGRAPHTGFWGRLSDDDRQIVDHAMRLVGIESMAHRRANSLSDGEHQKAMIARVLAQATPFILLDEPTAFLDFPGKIELMQLLARLAHEQGKTILLSTHDLETALQTADRLWLLDRRGICQGTPEGLAADGSIGRYIDRDDVRLDPSTMSISIIKQ